jgi:hypothetical protein
VGSGVGVTEGTSVGTGLAPGSVGSGEDGAVALGTGVGVKATVLVGSCVGLVVGTNGVKVGRSADWDWGVGLAGSP